MGKGIKVEHRNIDNKEYKLCPRCERWLSLDNFAKDKTRWDNLRDRCKECRKKTRNDAQELDYRRLPENITKKSQYDEKYKPQQRINQMEAYRTESREVKLTRLFRNRFRSAIKNNQKKGSAVRDLGTSVPKFIKRSESQFYPHPETGEPMTWENWEEGMVNGNLII